MSLSHDNAVILSIETATLGGSVSISQGRQLLAAKVGDAAISHSNTLLADIDRCLADASTQLENVTLFACAAGPGSFTGLRIGLATVKALAATMDRPCIGISTLAAIALSAGASAATVALLPAGRGEMFAQQFEVENDNVTALDKAAHLSPEDLFKRYGEVRQLLWAGPGALAHQELLAQQAALRGIELLKEKTGEGWRVAELDQNLAQYVARLALSDFEAGKIETPQTIQAIYVRPSDAEINRSWQ